MKKSTKQYPAHDEMPYGEYKGRKLRDVPEPLLRWVLDKTQDLHGEIRKVLGIEDKASETDPASLVQFIEYQESEISALKEEVNQLRDANRELEVQRRKSVCV